MGSWATRRRRTRTYLFGALLPPRDADWYLQPLPTSIWVHRVGPVPRPAWSWTARYRELGHTTWIQGPTQASTPIVISGLTTGKTYQVATAWYWTPARTSDWSSIKQTTCEP